MGSNRVARSSVTVQCQLPLRYLRTPNEMHRKSFGLPTLSCNGTSAIQVRRFGSVESRRFRVETLRSRTFVVRAQDDDKEQRGIDRVKSKSIVPWTSSLRRANMTSRIFVAAFVWILLFFGISVANNEVSGGRPGRRGPRK